MDVTAADDPVAAFLTAHREGRPVALQTSATSGPQRTVVRTTASWVSSFPTVDRLVALRPDSLVWVPGPLRATMNLFAAVQVARRGARLVPSLDAATHAYVTPTVLRACVDEGQPLAGVTVVVAGDRLPPALHDRATRSGARVHHYYGAAELSFVAWGGHGEDLHPFPGVEVAVREGEIWVRSPYVCTGTSGPPGPLHRDGDGFATVGDRGVLDGDRLTVLGRPDAVTTGGATVRVADVEAVLRPVVSGEVVVGVPHPGLGAVLAVVLDRLEDHAPALAAARERLDGPLRPRRWFQVDPLPLTAAGKVDRAAVVSLLSSGDRRVSRLV